VTTRSTVLFAENLSAGTNLVLFTCPVNIVTLFKSFHAFTNLGTSGQLYLKVSRPSNGALAWLLTSLVTTPEALTWEGWVALEPGDQVLIDVTGGSANVWGSGAFLPLGSQ
jgi:hypothetical protein